MRTQLARPHMTAASSEMPPRCPAPDVDCVSEAPEFDQVTEELNVLDGRIDSSSLGPRTLSRKRPPSSPEPHVPCTAGGRRPVESDFRHCPIPQSFVRCGPHHRAELHVLNQTDIDELYQIWECYRDDLSWPCYDKKPQFSNKDFETFHRIAQKVVDAMVEEYRQPMVLDQATISNTNHVGHPPHADNVQFDSVWWEGSKIKSEDEVKASQEGAYALWRTEKTSYRSYSCSVALSDPAGYEGGEVQFFKNWGDTDPIARYKCAPGHGIAFCGCQKNIHAVTGVKSGWRLVLLVWTRPQEVRVPDTQVHVCYFRPGTGYGVWLTSSDIRKCMARIRGDNETWVPTERDDGKCQCNNCVSERQKVAWTDCNLSVRQLADRRTTPSTSAGNSPRSPSGKGSGGSRDSTSEGTEEAEASSQSPVVLHAGNAAEHCPHPQPYLYCNPHERIELVNVLSKADIAQLSEIWQNYQDDLSRPWYCSKPTFYRYEFDNFHRIAQKVVDAMSALYKQPLVLDEACVSSTNHLGHPPHADNVQFDSVWWGGKQIKQKDEVVAAAGGAEVLWKSSKTNYRNYGASIALTEPEEYGGGEMEFYSHWGQKEPVAKFRQRQGNGIAFCGCQRNIHAVTGVRWGTRLVLLVWTRHPDATIPENQKQICHFRPGSGLSVWLTTADMEHYPRRRRKQQSWVPITKDEPESPESN